MAKNRAAQKLAKLRWKELTPEQRSEEMRRVNKAGWKSRPRKQGK